jgi:glycosyltransferase involved in cell wall biosynthesis
MPTSISFGPNPPLVSICIPAYNAERFIAATLESALAQDYPHFEIIVSDDCSTDRTLEILSDYAHTGVQVISQPRNLGMHANWNAVIRASNGKYVCKLDADDLLEHSYVSSMLQVMEDHQTIAFSHCACRLIDVEGKFMGYERSIKGSFIRNGLQEWPRYVFGPRAVNIVMIRRSAYEKVSGYDEKFAYTGDWKMHRDLLQIGDVFYNDSILASYRVHSLNKLGIKLLQAKEHLMHLEDMARNWPLSVAGKNRLLKKAYRLYAYELVKSMSTVSTKEAHNIYKFLPKYGYYWGPYLMAKLIRIGGGPLIRNYNNCKLMLRQVIKSFLYDQPRNTKLSSYTVPLE